MNVKPNTCELSICINDSLERDLVSLAWDWFRLSENLVSLEQKIRCSISSRQLLTNFYTKPNTISVSLDCTENVFQCVCILNSGSHTLFTRPTSTEFNKIFIKTGFHSTIHTFKNYFAIVFSVFNNKRYPNKPLILNIWT